MNKRVIGGAGFFLLVIGTVLLNLFIYLALIFIIIGLYELIQLNKIKKSRYLFGYTILFLIGNISLIMINNMQKELFLILIIAIMLNDTFAYFVGYFFGKTKFTTISTNKTIEGLIGGISLTNLIIILYFSLRYQLVLLDIIAIVMITTILLISSVFGDLAESKLKRVIGVKDSGKIVYGHGGILDRLDSWVLPGFIFIIVLAII